MRKIAIFVEGQTELILLRELILRKYNWQIDLVCANLFNKQSQYTGAEYNISNPQSGLHFKLINVGNDNAVLDRILQQEKYMWSSGYDFILGLRDMYSKEYREEAIDSQIKPELNLKFKTGFQKTIETRAEKPKQIAFFFAIMETETWIIGLNEIFTEFDNRLTNQFIEEKLGYNLENLDPETSFFHPYIELKRIFNLVDKEYGKHKNEVEAIAKKFAEYHDFLLEKPKCNSFKEFHNQLPN